MPPLDMSLPPAASFPIFLLLQRSPIPGKKIQTDVACVQPPLPSEKKGEGGGTQAKRTYKRGFIALVLAFLKFC